MSDPEFGTAGRPEVHILDGPWLGPRSAAGNESLCGLRLARRLVSVKGRETRVCQDCNERWMT